MCFITFWFARKQLDLAITWAVLGAFNWVLGTVRLFLSFFFFTLSNGFILIVLHFLCFFISSPYLYQTCSLFSVVALEAGPYLRRIRNKSNFIISTNTCECPFIFPIPLFFFPWSSTMRPEVQQDLAHTLLVELLAYQFASPVRWWVSDQALKASPTLLTFSPPY